MQSVLGPDAPKSIGAYRRMKRKDDESWKQLQGDYKSAIDRLDQEGPTGYATPRKRKGSTPGGSTAPKKKATAKKKTTGQSGQTKKSSGQTGQIPPPDLTPPTPDPPTQSGPKLSASDQKAIKKFDDVIDGIEFTDRRKTTKFILDSIPGHNMKIKIAKIQANGYVQPTIRGGTKIDISEFALQSQEHRPIQYQWKTMFHEFYHANMKGLDYKKSTMFNAEWTKWEETATETSALFMSQRAGIDISTITPSYANYLNENIPRLKQLPEFQDCETLSDFGSVFMKYRFDPDHASADWTWLEDKVALDSKPVNMNKYFVDHYKDHLIANKDRFVDMLFDSLQQQKSEGIRRMLSRGLDEGAQYGTVNREIGMILPVLMNEVGVKKP
jgi:hypothetical protein